MADNILLLLNRRSHLCCADVCPAKRVQRPDHLLMTVLQLKRRRGAVRTEGAGLKRRRGAVRTEGAGLKRRRER